MSLSVQYQTGIPETSRAGSATLPLLLAGPILRRATSDELVIWLVCADPVLLRICCYWDGERRLDMEFPPDHAGHLRIGAHAHLHLLTLRPSAPLPTGRWIEYDIALLTDSGEVWLSELCPDLTYPGETRMRFVIKTRIDELLYGSCRKPHHDSGDGLVLADDLLAQVRGTGADPAVQPALLLMTGDQVYLDDVAGPMLSAIHQVIERLGLPSESLSGSVVDDSTALYRHPDTFFQRERLLPDTKSSIKLRERFFGGVRKPIFTTDSAHNHLITLAEVLAMYLLVWSPQLWRLIDLTRPVLVDDAFSPQYEEELGIIERFVEGLPRVQRALAAVPTYMIFDDHDVTDDWNLTRGWEEIAYGHPFSRRIIGNALIGYLLCQGWGNAPRRFPDALKTSVQQLFHNPTDSAQDALIDRLLGFEHWQFNVPTQPKILALDTRTKRWWSQRNLSHPSGLMDWETLSDLQQEFIEEQAVLLISPAPIFGVKLIEVVQQIFTWFGHALTVDAENWMAHPGSANVILNIFCHRRTPRHFVILSGDVHYSFVYDVEVRHYKGGPAIWQITCSGFKNEFPARLLRLFDRLNRWLFASHSPLNWLTRRRAFRIRQRRPSPHSGRYQHQRLANGSGIGRLRLNDEGAPISIEMLWVNGECLRFTEGRTTDWVH